MALELVVSFLYGNTAQRDGLTLVDKVRIVVRRRRPIAVIGKALIYFTYCQQGFQ